MRSLRVRLAVVGFLAIYLPVLLLFVVTLVTQESVSERRNGVEVVADRSKTSPWAIVTLVALAPAAAGLAWWWAGRAVRPIARVASVAEEIEASDLSRRIALDDGPAEIMALAASFDAMLARLEQAAGAQRRLIEETSHELRTPLAVLSTNADVLLRHPEPTLEVYREGLARSRVVAVQLQATIDELLVDARGRARTLDRRPADLAAIAVDVIDSARVMARSRGVALELAGVPHASARLDEASVRRALANLVDNAIRFAPAGSAVEVCVTADDTEASVTVTDQGPGIAAEQRPHVFDRFWRGPDAESRTGLGLPIARQIALAHGGDVELRETDKGCSFVLQVRR